MPRKNKKKQRKEERRRAVQRVRQEKGWQPPPDLDYPDDELTRDLLTFAPEMGAGPAGERVASETLTNAVLESADLADEPELREFYFHPMQAIDHYGEIEKERGISEQMLESLSAEEEDELFSDLMIEIARGQLTEEMQAELLEAMEAAWQRVRQEGDQEKAGRLAAVLSLLGDADNEAFWPVSGVLQAILRRSLDAGFELLAVLEAEEGARTGPRAVFQSGLDEGFQQRVAAIMDRYPGLAAVLAQQDQEVWEDGIVALMEGELYAGFFSDEELERAAELFNPETLGDPHLAGEELARAGIRAVHDYLTGLLTLERRAEIREQLLTLLEDEAIAGEWYSFLMAMLEDLEDEDLEAPVHFLTAALIGEMSDLADEEDAGEA